MNYYIHADMEGTAGIRAPSQVDHLSADFAAGRRLLVRELNVAVAALFEHGASAVMVCDAHGTGHNLDLAELDPRATLERPVAGCIMPSLDASFAGVLLLGHHAMAGTRDGFLEHTMSSREWFDYRIDGVAAGEIAIEAAWAGHFGVPVVVVGGDEATAAEAAALLPGVATAITKRGLGRNAACCLPLEDCDRRLRAAIAQGCARPPAPWRPRLPARVELTFQRADLADACLGRPGLERLDGRTVARTVDDARQLMITW